MDVSIVIPAFKESAKIERDIAAADAFLRSRPDGGEILLVDDGSPDDTAAAARALQAQYPSLRVVSYARNRGKGHAIAQGVLQARCGAVMYADAGLCVPFEIATIGISMLELDMCDVEHGSRRKRGSVLRAQPLSTGEVGSLAYKVRFVHAGMGVPRYISDTQCGFKIYRREAARELYGDLLTDGFMFDVEIILRALRHGYRILEFPVLWSNDADTRYDPIKGTIRNLKELARIRWSMLTEQREGAILRAERTSRRESTVVT